MRNVFWWAIGGFAVYELVAWKVNDSRITAAQKRPGPDGMVTYKTLPFDLIGKYIGYPSAGLGPEIPGIPVAAGAAFPPGVAAGLANPAAARAAAFNANNYPGLAPMSAPQFDINDPLGLNRAIVN